MFITKYDSKFLRRLRNHVFIQNQIQTSNLNHVYIIEVK